MTLASDPIALKLVENGVLAKMDLDRAMRLAAEDQAPLRQTLDRLGLSAPGAWADAAADAFNCQRFDPSSVPSAPVAETLFSEAFLRRKRVLPLEQNEAGITIAICEPGDRFLLNALGLAADRPVRLVVATERELDEALDQVYGTDEGVEEETETALVDDADVARLRDLAGEAPVVRWVNDILARAAELHASDIHLEPGQDGLTVRYRIDGLLTEDLRPSADMSAAILSRVKILAGLDIAERRLPQDGRIRWRAQGREIDLRVATAPNLEGESVVMRLLERGNKAPAFEDLGFTAKLISEITPILERKQGLILVTGPTGSGKTTTLYAGLSHLTTAERKIVTVEDPVEYRLPGVMQMQVKADIGLSFSTALRSLVRQDPDIMMIGEIRDQETASIAVQSALTGHLVLSTLHTNDAAGAVTRLMDMGIEDYLLSATLNAVIAQRLVRRLCPVCKTEVKPTPTVMELFDRHKVAVPDRLLEAKGCDACQGRGYSGRLAVAEFIPFGPNLSRLINSGADVGALREAAHKLGYESLIQSALHAVSTGDTSYAEVLRVMDGA